MTKDVIRFNELLKKLNELTIIQKSSWEEDIPAVIWIDYFTGNYDMVASGLDTDTHRWYETSTTVIEIFGCLLGVNQISNIFSESITYEDCWHILEFFEMKPVKTTTYKAK